MPSQAAHSSVKAVRDRQPQRPKAVQRKVSKRAQAHGVKSADRAHEGKEKSATLSYLPFWWLTPDGELPRCPLPSDRVTVTQELKNRAIAAMHEFGVKVEASRASGMGRRQLNQELESDPVFKEDMLRARRECMERLEREMIRRGMFKGGDLAGIFALKHNTKRYREVQRVELTGKDGTPFNQSESLAAQLLEKLASLKGSQGQGSEGPRGLAGKQEIVIERSEGGSEGSPPLQLSAGGKGKKRRPA